MQEVVVYICSILAIALVVCGFIHRKRIDEHGSDNVNKGQVYTLNDSDLSGRERFISELTKAGFRDETIEDMYEKILDMKGSVTFSDAIAIIHVLEPIMKIRKDDN